MELCIKKDKLEKSIELVDEKLCHYDREKLFNIEILKECFKITKKNKDLTKVITSEILSSAPRHETAIAEVIDDNLISIV